MATIHLGPFRLDPQNELLFRGTEPAALGRRAAALLRELVRQPGQLVSKDALIEAAWPGQSVEESNLTVQIAALRRVLGEAPGGAGWIETMPRRGYRFVGPVVTGEENSVAAAVALAQVVAPLDVAAIEHGEAEHRQITVMSCEATGAAARADGIGLEALLEAIGAFQHCVSEIVGRHSGFIASRLGNTVLVLFGYPAAHEHDAEQAIHAGLELCAVVRNLRADADVPMRCRVGIATRMVIVGDLVGIGELPGHGIVGDAPDLAVQLRVSAQPDTVTIEPTTWRLIGNLFDCRQLGTLDTNTDTEPIRRWQVLGESVVASRFEALHGSKLSPLVGRDDEIDLLFRRWTRAKVGEGQIMLVSGEAGIGKSRITAAFEERLHTEPHLRLRYSARLITRTARCSRSSTNSVGRPGSCATILPLQSWRNWRPCWLGPPHRTRTWRCSSI
jgi:DNA-binding winged helix-turn-helix (wHTH) protein